MKDLRRVGRCLLGERMGSGGMGNVYYALWTGPLGFARPVAIKELHPHLARDADFVAMLLDEARIQGAIAHPNVVPVLDAIAIGGELFIILGLVIGASLAEVRRSLSRPVPEEIVVAIGCDLLEGLHAAHELRDSEGRRLGVVHRDVSPHNVLVGADGVARVLDFGVAKARARAQATRDGAVKGKPRYMSPEQRAGEDVDRRADVFSTGVVLCELLAPLPRDLGDAAEDVDPSAYIRKLETARVTPSLLAVLARCLAADPADRFTTARDAAVAFAEAVPPASASAVASWLAAQVSDLVTEREHAVLSLRASAEREPDTITEASAPPPRKAPTKGRALVGASVLVLLASVSGFAVGRMDRGIAASRGAGSTPAAPPAYGSTLSTASTAPPPASPAHEPRDRPEEAIPSPSESTPAPAAASAYRPRSMEPPVAVHRASAHTKPQRPETPPGACDPPFTIDAVGVRIFKPECL